MMYDVVIIGGGPCGLSAGLALKEKGISYVIIEKEAIVNSIVNCPTDIRFYSTSDRLEIGDIPFLSQEVRPTRTELLKYYRLVTERQDININCFQKVESITKDNNSFTINATDRKGTIISYQAKKIIIATGIYDHPKKMGVEGEGLPKVMHYYKEGHYYYGQQVTVVGGKNSAIEAAIDLYRNGAQVTLVHRGESVYQGIKPSLLLDIRNFIEKEKIKFYPNSSVAKIDELTISLHTPEGNITIPNDYVFSLIGYQPDLNMLQSLGIQMDPSSFVPAFNSDTYETNVPNVYLAGVVTGGVTNRVFIEDGRFHGLKIAEDIERRLNA
ncbi:YpdA family putative bacillithiol disulfide reductase [Bacillus sp. S/N-304-OC-R1]|uniref:YpdA family putative bacillithiol disulfide reductase n=1 Tax=Bacillus sp. S/N-304-OC-R1 TaxID=2758034 RepID=UPI001C8EEA2E|nr:YpdA family putative bacillithiol disulfide reductase [Bacillus sp. S/N-304-OC-R1]MBY0123588.1 YpdA family putative bacillithiol disulfide reductase [Bacillus sp. S/N-304-OC-R1]